MSIKVMSWVFERGPRDPSERLVLLALADYAADNGEWAPSMIGIAEKAGMTERGARGVIRRLEADGWIDVRVGGGRGGRSHYRILMGAEKPEQQTGNGKPGIANPECGDDKPGTKRAKTRNQRSAEPSGTIKEPSNSSARAKLCEVIRPETADAYIALRKAKRAVLTDYAAALIAKKLRGRSDADAVVEESIANGWTGIFPERSATAPPRPSTDLDAAFAAANKILSERPQ